MATGVEPMEPEIIIGKNMIKYSIPKNKSKCLINDEEILPNHAVKAYKNIVTKLNKVIQQVLNRSKGE